MSICLMSICAMSICVMSICVHSYPERNLHTASRQTRKPERHQHKNFAPPIGTATPNAIYTQQAAKPACQEDIDATFSHLLLAQLPRTQFTHSKPPHPHASNTSPQNFRICYWQSYPERNLHTASRQTRMPERHQHKNFAPPIGTATPNAIYTQQAAKPACQEDIDATFSHLLLAQLPRTQFTHSKPPHPHASNTSTQNFRICYWQSYPERNLHTASRQTRMPGRHQRKIFASPIGTATPNTIYTQQAAKPECQQHINAKFLHLLLAQLPRTQFTHSKPPNPHARKASTQNFRTSYWHSYPERNVHTASRQTRMQGRHQRKIFAPPIGRATPNAIYTQQAAKPACQQHITAKFSHLLLAQLPRTQFTHSKPPNPHARKTSAQNFRSSYWHSYPERNLHTASRQTRMPERHQRKIFASPFGAATPNAIYTQQAAKPACQEDIKAKFSHLLLAQLPQTQFAHSKAPNPHASNTSTQILASPIATATPSPTPATQKSSGQRGGPRTPKRTSDPLQRRKPHACHAKVQRPARRPANTKAYIRPPAAPQVPRLPRKSPAASAAAREHQSVHQTPCSAASPTPATQKSGGKRGGPRTPKRTSDPLQRRKPHACHAKVRRQARRPAKTKAPLQCGKPLLLCCVLCVVLWCVLCCVLRCVLCCALCCVLCMEERSVALCVCVCVVCWSSKGGAEEGRGGEEEVCVRRCEEAPA